MNVDDAMAYASKDKCFWTGEVHTALETLAAEVERLRDELAEAKAANVALVDVIDCYFNKLNDLENITNWLRDRIKKRVDQ